MGSLVDDVQLVVSELVTNALLHANPPFTVILAAFERTVRLEVLDGGSYLVPSLVVAQSLETTGRGVAIVEAMSRDWGVTSGSSGGKSVWAEFDIPGATHG
jgi:anti-sigma regulatory factor (Ser/Thr protein kinase)